MYLFNIVYFPLAVHERADFECIQAVLHYEG